MNAVSLLLLYYKPLPLPEDWLLQERRRASLKLASTNAAFLPTTRGPGLISNVLSILLLDGAIAVGDLIRSRPASA